MEVNGLQQVFSIFFQNMNGVTRIRYFMSAAAMSFRPLTTEEEGDLLSRMGTGDEKVRSTLIEHNLRLVVYIARRFENTGIRLKTLYPLALLVSLRQ